MTAKKYYIYIYVKKIIKINLLSKSSKNFISAINEKIINIKSIYFSKI